MGALFLDRVDQEVAALAGARLAGMGQPEPLAGLGQRRSLLFARVVVCAIGADGAGWHRGGRASVQMGPRVGQG